MLGSIRQKFWTGLLEKAKQKTKLHAGTSAGTNGWIQTSAGPPSGLAWGYTVRRHDNEGFLYIDADRDTGQGNKVILDQLMLHQERIEQDFGGPLDWLPMEGKRACVIRKKIAIGGWQDEERWPESQEALVDTMVAIEAAIRPFLDQINKV